MNFGRIKFYFKNDKKRGFDSFTGPAEYSQLQGSNGNADNDHVSDH